jgi:hypothetical protein
VTNDNGVKLEPRDQASPYNAYGYRDVCLATPSPQPNSPQTFAPVSPAPHYNIDTAGNNILQHQLTQNQAQPQTPRFTQNNFQQHENHIYTPNILAPAVSFVNGSSPNWTNNLNGNAPLASNRDFMSNSQFTSPLFQLDSRNIQSQAPTVMQSNIPVNVEAPNEPRLSSILMDLDNQLFNISGELQSFSLSDIPMNSFSALESKDDKSRKPNQNLQKWFTITISCSAILHLLKVFYFVWNKGKNVHQSKSFL